MNAGRVMEGGMSSEERETSPPMPARPAYVGVGGSGRR